jgi:hypothetical protein
MESGPDPSNELSLQRNRRPSTTESPARKGTPSAWPLHRHEVRSTTRYRSPLALCSGRNQVTIRDLPCLRLRRRTPRVSVARASDAVAPGRLPRRHSVSRRWGSGPAMSPILRFCDPCAPVCLNWALIKELRRVRKTRFRPASRSQFGFAHPGSSDRRRVYDDHDDCSDQSEFRVQVEQNACECPVLD